MKKKLLLMTAALMCALGTWAYTTSDLTDAGWTKITSLPTSNAELSKYYYVLWATEADLMLAQENGAGLDGDAQENYLTGVYRTPANPVTNKKFVWLLEYDATFLYGIRNLSNSHLLMQSREESPWRVQFHWEQKQSKWTRWNFSYVSNKWRIENKACNKESEDTYFSNVFLGPWKAHNDASKPGFADNMVVAGNKTGDDIGDFDIYAIPRVTYNLLYNNDSYDYSTATYDSPLDITIVMFNADISDNSCNGWISTGSWGNQQGGSGAFESWNNTNVDISQTLFSLPNGFYSVSADVIKSSGGSSAKVYATGDATVESSAVSATASADNYSTMCSEVAGHTLSTVNVKVSNNKLVVGIKDPSGWFVFDNFNLYYYGNAVEACPPTPFSSGNSATASTWYAFTVSSAGIYKIAANSETTIYYTQDDSDDADETASVTLKGSGSNYYTFVRLATGTFYFKVDATKNISITEGYAVNDDLTSLLANPDFSTNDLSGWTINTSSGYSNPTVDTNNKDCEFYEKKFDMSQTLTGMKKGTYEVSFQAFQRPGGNSNELLAAYKGGTWTSLATLKTSAERTAVPNIYSADRTTAIFSNAEKGEVWPYDLSATYNETKYYVPNSMEGARKWFDTEVGSTGVNYYTTTARAICTEDGGSMYFGFEGDLTGTSAAWLIFANFQLKYIDTDVLVDPTASETLIAEATTLAARAMKSSVRTALQSAIHALEAEKTSGDLYAALEAEMTTATASADNYALLATAITNVTNARKTANEGSGVFQIPTSAGSTLATAIATAQGVYDAESVSDVSSAVTTLNSAKSTYDGATLNAPDSEKRYYIKVATAEHEKLNNAVVTALGGKTANNPTGYSFNASTAPNVNLSQAFTFTQVSGNTYNISIERPEGTVYMTYGSLNGSAAGWNEQQIQGTTDSSKKGVFRIVATATANVFNIVNTVYDHADNYLDCQDGGSIYTDTNIDKKDFTIAEAPQASVELSIHANKLATRIFPFTPTLPEGVEAYTCDATKNESYLALTKEDNPVANTPYILYSENEVESTNITGWGTATADSYSAGYLTGVFARTEVPEGCYVLQTQAGKQAFYKVDQTGAYSSPYRVYLTVPASSPVKMFDFTLEDIETAIEAARAEGENTVILRYNVAGQQMQNAQKGLNIIKMSDGSVRKILVK